MSSQRSFRLGKIGHLTRRWWLSVRAGPPTPTDEAWAMQHLLPTEQELWAHMSAADRTHAVMVARRFLTGRPEATRAEMAGALLHDVGKIRSELGTTARVIATVIPPRLIQPWLIPPWLIHRGPLGSTTCERFQNYRDHERIGIDLLLSIGSDSQTIELLQGHGPAAAALAQADHI